MTTLSRYILTAVLSLFWLSTYAQKKIANDNLLDYWIDNILVSVSLCKASRSILRLVFVKIHLQERQRSIVAWIWKPVMKRYSPCSTATS